MMTNKEAGLLEPDEKAIESLENIKKMDEITEKLKQVGMETLFWLETCDNLLRNIENNDKIEVDSRLYQLFGNIYYYMCFLRIFATECPDPSKNNSMILVDSIGENIYEEIEFVKKLDTLGEKLEQIGMEVHFLVTDCEYALKNYLNKKKAETDIELYQLLGKIHSYMDCLMELKT